MLYNFTKKLYDSHIAMHVPSFYGAIININKNVVTVTPFLRGLLNDL